MKWLFSLAGFIVFYLWEVVVANLRIAKDILSPIHRLRHEYVTIQLEPLTPIQLLVLTNVITMTPGTLCIDVSSDGRELLIHSLYSNNKDELTRSIKDDYERRVRRVF